MQTVKKDYAKEGMKSARAFAKIYGVTDKADIAIIAKQFEYDLRKSDEFLELGA